MREFLDDLRSLVEVESPSLDLPAMERSAATLAALIERRLGRGAELVAGAAGPHVLWPSEGPARVLIVGHHDTVFPAGALAARPFTVDGDRVTGPGVFDMKGGIVQAIHAVAALDDRTGIELLFTADEEVGSGTSRTLIEERARAAGAVLVLEPSADGGALKTGRKGTGTFVVTVEGRAAHAGLEPEKGVNALVEAAHLVLAINALGDPAQGTTVTPTIAAAGSADNVVPAAATIKVDVRVENAAETARVEAAMAALQPTVPGAGVTVAGGVGRPPMPVTASAELFALAERAARDAGLAPISGVAVGGGSDGNFTAAIGVPTLDGLGAVGGGAHAEHEHLILSSVPARIALLQAILHAIHRSR
jgi:glutamate carboxypeptidase